MKKQLKISRFWEPSLKDFWKEEHDEETKKGFPCFLVYLHQPVKQGDEGDEEPTKIMKNLLFIHPNNVPEDHIVALLKCIITFETFSQISLKGRLKTLTWSNSIIAIEQIPIDDGSVIIFALKMPRQMSTFATRQALQRTVYLLQIVSPTLKSTLTQETYKCLKTFFLMNRSYIQNTALFCRDYFSFVTNSIFQFSSKSALIIATQLFYFIRCLSKDVIGSALFRDSDLILSEIKQPLLGVLPVFISCDEKLVVKQHNLVSLFCLFGENTEEYTLARIKYGNLAFMIYISGKVTNDSLYTQIQALIIKGVQDFQRNCDQYNYDRYIHGDPAIINWPTIGVSQRSKMSEETQKRLLTHFEAMGLNPLIRELGDYNGATWITSVDIPRIRLTVEVKPESNANYYREAIARMKQVFPNLPINPKVMTREQIDEEKKPKEKKIGIISF